MPKAPRQILKTRSASALATAFWAFTLSALPAKVTSVKLV